MIAAQAIRLLPLLIAISLAAAAPRPACAQAAEPAADGGAIVVPIQGELSEMMVALTIRAIRRAHETGATALIFEIDTEGGRADLMDRLIDEIERAEELRTIAFVTQKAASAGALVAISCQRLYMKPGSNIGSALPIFRPPFGLPIDPKQIAGGQDDDFFEKIRSHFQAHFRAKAEARHRPPALAEAMVYSDEDVFEVEVDGVRHFVRDRSKELDDLITAHGEAAIHRLRTVCRKGEVLNLTAQEAMDDGMIDGLATGRADLLEQVGLSSAPIVELRASWSENLADVTQRYGIVLLIAGLVAVFIELKVPGFGLPGIIGSLLIALYLFGKYLVGLAEITEILLILAGFGLIAVEVLVLPGTMFSGILGVIALVTGLVLASQQTVLPQADRPYAEAQWWSNVRSLSIGLMSSVVGMFLVAHFFPRIPLLNRAILRTGTGATSPAGTGAASGAARPLDEVDAAFRPSPGARGVARTVLRPAGKVEIDGRELDAVSEGPMVDRGGAVVVVRVEAAHVVVRRDDAKA